jgi:hypothetical protein
MGEYTKTIGDCRAVDSAEMFSQILVRMHQEGNGAMCAQIIVPRDAAVMALKLMFGIEDPRSCWQEINEFLSKLEETRPVCSCSNCVNDLVTQKDVGAMVVVHGDCDYPTAVVVAGLCETCWTGRCEKNPEKGLEAFMEHMRSIVPSMEVIDKGNGPDLSAKNDPAYRMPDIPFDPSRLN